MGLANRLTVRARAVLPPVAPAKFACSFCKRARLPQPPGNVEWDRLPHQRSFAGREWMLKRVQHDGRDGTDFSADG